MLMIKGSELHVSRLTLEKGEIDIEGRIDSLTYSENAGYGKSGESDSHGDCIRYKGFLRECHGKAGEGAPKWMSF